MVQRTDLLVWMDLEMTGLNPTEDKIIEIATLLTDGHLNLVAEGPEIIIKAEPEWFTKMDEWNQNTHTKSGLWASCLKSTKTMADAEQETLDFLKQHLKPGTSPLCGNSIWQDRRFLCQHMPKLESYMHYRIIDVSTIKELTRRWQPDSLAPEKPEIHRALDDIMASVNELKHYRQSCFKI